MTDNFDFTDSIMPGDLQGTVDKVRDSKLIRGVPSLDPRRGTVEPLRARAIVNALLNESHGGVQRFLQRGGIVRSDHKADNGRV